MVSVRGVKLDSSGKKIIIELEVDVTSDISQLVQNLRSALLELTRVKDMLEKKYGKIEVINKNRKCMMFTKRRLLIKTTYEVCNDNDINKFIELVENINKLIDEISVKALGRIHNISKP